MKFETGGMWESSEFEIKTNVDVKKWSGIELCKHCHSLTTTNDGVKFICPKVVIATNEGGFNSTGVCLDCIIEAAKVIDRLENQNH